MGWFRVEADAWPVIAEALPLPWSREACCTDLRWWVDQEGAPPSRRQLAKRWGWTDGRVRVLLRNVDQWWDAGKGEPPRLAAPRPSRAGVGPSGTQRDPAGPRKDPGRTGEPCKPQARDPAGPSGTQRDPEATTRVPTHTTGTLTSTDERPAKPAELCPGEATPTAEPSTKAEAKAPPAWRKSFDALDELWRQLHADHGARRPPAMRPDRGLGKALKTTLQAYEADEVSAVMRWYWAGRHDRARFLRDKGMGLKTLLRPSNFEEYLGMSVAPVPPAPVTGSGWNAAQDAPGRTLDDAAELQRKAAKLAEFRNRHKEAAQ